MLSPLLDRVKEDLFETVIGAVALDCDWNAETLDIVEALEYIHIKAEAVKFLDDCSPSTLNCPRLFIPAGNESTNL